MTDTHDAAVPGPATFSTATEGLRECGSPEVVELADGDAFELRIGPVVKRIGRRPSACSPTTARFPGRRCGCRQGSRGSVNVRTTADHRRRRCTGTGCASANRYDGTHETQAPIRSAATSPIGCASRIRASTGTTRTSARTTARNWASTATSSSSPPTRTTGRRSIASSLLTLDDILLEDGARSRRSLASGPTYVGDGPLRQRPAHGR